MKALLHCVLVCATVTVSACDSGHARCSRSEREQIGAKEERFRHVIAYCQSLVPGDAGKYRTYLRSLAEKKDYDALSAIYSSDFTFSEWAAEEVAKALPPTDAVTFCQRFRPGSPNWRAAFLALQYQPKESIAGYVSEMVSHPDPYARYACYKLCLILRWDLAAGYAELDRRNDSFIGQPNNEDEMVLGQVAEKYLKAIQPLQQQ